MATEQDFKKIADELHQLPKKHTIAEYLFKVLEGKIIEVYIGDSYEDIKWDDATQKIPAVLIGRFIAAYAECLVLDCAYADQTTKKLKFGNIVCLNERAIRTVTELNDNGVIKDTFISTNDSKQIKELFGK